MNEDFEELIDKFDNGTAMIYNDKEIDGRVLYFDSDSVYLCVGTEEIQVNLLETSIDNFEEI